MEFEIVVNGLSGLSDAELWVLIGDISYILNQKKMDADDKVFFGWYQLFRSAEKEADRRIAEDSLQ